MSDWNATRYHEISAPQQAWGRRMLERLDLAGHELVLDIGCGTGRLTAEIARRVPAGRVVGVDRSPAMLETAAAWLAESAPSTALVLADATALPFRRVFDLVFSAATFHWVADHGALFRSIITTLRPGGRLVAQCGGGPNIALLLSRAEGLMRTRYVPYFQDWQEPWYFADVDSTRRRLEAAGFVDVEVGIEAAPATFATAQEYAEFVATVCVRHHLQRLPAIERAEFVRQLTLDAAGDPEPFTLDYWRLNLAGRRPSA